MIIRNNENNTIVYQNIISSFQLFHTLPAEIIENGISYNAQIRVFDINNEMSSWSNTIVFFCLRTPNFKFRNLELNQIINNSSYEFFLEYNQENNEPLNICKFILYQNQVEKYNSGLKFGNNLLSDNISGLEDNNQYQIRATGETLNGMIVDTGLINFSISYIEPSLFAIVHLENLCHSGEVRIQSNIKSIIGTSYPDPPIYRDDTKVDLTENGTWVMFDEGISIKDNFALQIDCNSLNSCSTILIMTNEKYRIELHYMVAVINEKNVAYLILKASNAITNYYQTSNYIEIPRRTDNLYILIRKINQTYQVFLNNGGGDYVDVIPTNAIFSDDGTYTVTEQNQYLELEEA